MVQIIDKAMAKDAPNRYVVTMTKKARHGRIFIDYFRNGRGATAVGAYSTRALARAPISTPQANRRRAAIVMNNDGVAFILLCVVTRNTLVLPISHTLLLSAGAALAVLGVGTKLWAARTLGSEAYYWHNFFDPAGARGPVASGPYRFVSNPMYGIGYLQTYGLALMLQSLPGLIASAFAQAAMHSSSTSVKSLFDWPFLSPSFCSNAASTS